METQRVDSGTLELSKRKTGGSVFICVVAANWPSCVGAQQGDVFRPAAARSDPLHRLRQQLIDFLPPSHTHGRYMIDDRRRNFIAMPSPS